MQMNSNLLIHIRIAELRKVVIFHPQYQAAFDIIKDAYEIHKNVGLSQHLLCVGQSGTGKSTLKSLIRDMYPPVQLEDRLLVPVLCVDTPSQPTIRNMAEAMLIQLGEPCFTKGSAVDKTNRILNLIRAKSVGLIIFDELQHFIDRGRKKSPLEVSDWLKTLIDQTHASTVLMGLQRSEKILEVNEQLRRRYSRRLELRPFSLDNEIEQSIFAGVIRHFDEQLGLPERINLCADILKRFYFATNGIIDYIVRLLIGAFEYSLKNSLDIISIEVLEFSFTERIWCEGQGKLNPFNRKFLWRKLDQPGMPFNLFEYSSLQRTKL